MLCRGGRIQLDSVDQNGIIFSVTLNTLHAVVTDLFRIQVAAITFSATDTFPIIQDTRMLCRHQSFPPLDADIIDPIREISQAWLGRP